MARRRARPAEPADILMEAARRRAEDRAAAADPANWGPSQQVTSALVTSADVEVSRAGGKVARARRRDLFRLLLNRGASDADAHRAAERYCLDRETALGARGRSAVPLAPGKNCGRAPDLVNDIMIDAGARVAELETRMGARSAAVLKGVVDDLTSANPAGWRQAVRRASGETLPDAQGALVRLALGAASDAYGAMDRRRRDETLRNVV